MSIFQAVFVESRWKDTYPANTRDKCNKISTSAARLTQPSLVMLFLAELPIQAEDELVGHTDCSEICLQEYISAPHAARRLDGQKRVESLARLLMWHDPVSQCEPYEHDTTEGQDVQASDRTGRELSAIQCACHRTLCNSHCTRM